MLTLRGAMNGQTTRTIGTLTNGDVTLPLVLRISKSTGCVTPCTREDGKLYPISGRFRTDQTFEHLRNFLETEALDKNTKMNLVSDITS